MRLFIAVVIPEEVKAHLEQKVKVLKDSLPADLKWVSRKNWHLTLKFLGETRKDRLPDIKKVLSTLAERNSKTEIIFRGITAFPRKEYPRVIVTTVKEGAVKVEGLHQELEEGLAELGFKKDNKSFTPHLTLARSRRNTDMKGVSRGLQRLNQDLELPLAMTKIALIKSELHRSGPVYQELFAVTLAE